METIALGILFLGDNPYGWRIVSLIFSLLTLTAFYFLAWRYAPFSDVPFASTLLLAFSTMFFSIGSLGVFDIFYLFWAVLAFYFWLGEGRLSPIFAGLCLGVSLAYKISLIPLAFVLLAFLEKEKRKFALLVPSTFLSFLLALTLGEIIYAHGNLAGVVDPILRLKTIFLFHSSLKWDQALTPKFQPPIHPIWWLIASQPYKWALETLPKNPFLAGFGGPVFAFSIPAIYYMVKRKAWLPVAWWMGTYLAWLPLTLIVTRPLYYFYALSFLPACCLANATWLSWKRRFLTIYIVICILFFLVCHYPWRGILDVP